MNIRDTVSGLQERRRSFAAPVLILQPVIFYWSVIVTRSRHIPYDLESYHYPTLAYIAACVRSHQSPFWDPYTYGGMPLHADIQAQMFYPPAWLAIIAGNFTEGRDLFYWVEWLVAGHMILAGVFAYLLLRRMKVAPSAAFLGATVYQLGGFFASQACHLGAISAGAWLPLALIAVRELRQQFRPRAFCVLSLAIALTILSGYAATTIVVVGAVSLYAAARSPWRLLPVVAAAALFAMLICCVQLVPMLRLTALSIASLRSEWLTAWGAPLESLVSLVAPDHFHIFDLAKYKLPFNFTLLYVYCGIIPLGLFLTAPFTRRARLYFALTLLCGVWMLGEHTPVYPFFLKGLPQLIRGASYAWYAMMAFCLFLGVTAALVMNQLAARVPRGLLWVLAIATSFDLLYAGSNRPMNTAEGSFAQSNSEVRYRRSSKALKALHALVDTSTPPLRIDYADIWSPGIIMGPMLRLPTTDGNIPFMQRRMFRLRQIYCSTEPSARDAAIAGKESPIFRRDLPVVRFDSPLLRMQNVAFIAGVEPIAGAAQSIAGLDIYRVPGTLPRFFLASAVRSSAGADETFRLLSDPDFQPEEQAIVEGLPSTGYRANGGVQVLRYTPTRVELEVNSGTGSFLATSEAWYPGWSATVNGADTQMYITNGAFRGLAVPAGVNRIVMTYWPVDFTWSAIVSFLSILFAVALATLNRDNFERGRKSVESS